MYRQIILRLLKCRQLHCLRIYNKCRHNKFVSQEYNFHLHSLLIKDANGAAVGGPPHVRWSRKSYKRANAAAHMLPLFFLWVGAAAREVPQHTSAGVCWPPPPCRYSGPVNPSQETSRDYCIGLNQTNSTSSVPCNNWHFSQKKSRTCNDKHGLNQ